MIILISLVLVLILVLVLVFVLVLLVVLVLLLARVQACPGRSNKNCCLLHPVLAGQGKGAVAGNI